MPAIRFPYPGARRRAAVVSLLAIGLFVPMRTHAQPVPVPYSWAWAGGPTPTGAAGAIYCGIGPSNAQMGAGTNSAACTSASGLPGASYTVFGRVGAGQTGAAVAITADGVGFPGEYGYLSWWSTGYSRWADRLSFVGDVQPSTVELTVSWDGQLAGDLTFQGPGRVGGFASATWAFTATSPDGELARYQRDASRIVSRNFPPGDAVNAADVRTFVVPVGASSYVDFLYDLYVNVNIYGTFESTTRVSGQLSADFGQTGKLVGLVARDASGNDITAQTQYTFANGTQISVAAVPEPGTWALLTTGLFAMGGLVRRRRIG